MIPVILLWNVKIKRSQKFLIGVFLCLSVCMIICAIVRASGIHPSKTILDVQWEIFFQQIEASISVMTVSMTAFRSLLGLNTLKSRQKKERAWYSYRRILSIKKEQKSSESELNRNQLPAIPGATFTGIRTFIRGDRDSKVIHSNNGEADVVCSRDGIMEAEEHILVTRKISFESETVRFSTRAFIESWNDDLYWRS